MDWSNESYVRIYLRDTTTWRRLGFDGTSVLMHVLRKVDMAGVLDIEDLEPWEAVALHCGAPEDFARAGMAKCLRLKVLAYVTNRDEMSREEGGLRGALVAPNFVEAQTASKSDKLRTKESRERRRAGQVSRIVTTEEQNVTNGHAGTQPVTTGHDRSPYAMLCYAVREGALTPEASPDPAQAHPELQAPEPPGTHPIPDGSGSVAHALRQEFESRYAKKKASSPPKNRAYTDGIKVVAAWCEAKAQLSERSATETLGQLLDGFFASKNPKVQGDWGIRFLAQDPDEFYPRAVATRPATPVPPPPPQLSAAERDENARLASAARAAFRGRGAAK